MKIEEGKLVIGSLEGCFAKGTNVLMADGSIECIENIEVGNKVMGKDGRPREVIKLPRGRETMYSVVQKSQHRAHKSDSSREVPELLKFTCNATHELVVRTPRSVRRLSRTIKGVEYFEVITFEMGQKKAPDGRIVELVKEVSKSYPISEGPERANELVESYRKASNKAYFEWTIEARDLSLLGSHVRKATYQTYAPILYENDHFFDYMQKSKFHLTIEGPKVLAYLLGLWIGDGLSDRATFSVDSRDTSLMERVTEYAEKLNLCAEYKDRKEPQVAKTVNLYSKVVRGASTNPGVSAWQVNTAYTAGQLVTYNGKTYKCLQPHTSLAGWEPSNVPALWQLQGGHGGIRNNLNTENPLWDAIVGLGFLKDGVKNIPSFLSTDNIGTRETFLAGLIDSDGYVTDEHGIKATIKTIHTSVRDGLVSLARSLGLVVSVNAEPAKVDMNVTKHKISYAIYMSGGDVLLNVLSKCAGSKKFRPAPAAAFARECRGFYFELQELKEDDYYGITLSDDSDHQFLLGSQVVVQNMNDTRVLFVECNRHFLCISECNCTPDKCGSNCKCDSKCDCSSKKGDDKKEGGCCKEKSK